MEERGNRATGGQQPVLNHQQPPWRAAACGASLKCVPSWPETDENPPVSCRTVLKRTGGGSKPSGHSRPETARNDPPNDPGQVRNTIMARNPDQRPTPCTCTTTFPGQRQSVPCTCAYTSHAHDCPCACLGPDADRKEQLGWQTTNGCAGQRLAKRLRPNRCSPGHAVCGPRWSPHRPQM